MMTVLDLMNRLADVPLDARVCISLGSITADLHPKSFVEYYDHADETGKVTRIEYELTSHTDRSSLGDTRCMVDGTLARALLKDA